MAPETIPRGRIRRFPFAGKQTERSSRGPRSGELGSHFFVGRAFEFEPRRRPLQLCMSVRGDGDCGNVTEDISLKLKEEASEGGRALSGSKGPSRHLGLDKRAWQISKRSPMYYISVRTPSASLPLCTFISDTDILT